MRSRAIALGQKIREEDGVTNAVEAFHRHLSTYGVACEVFLPSG
jgi:hypothetical protein